MKMYSLEPLGNLACRVDGSFHAVLKKNKGLLKI